jgi:hypothetical protein
LLRERTLDLRHIDLAGFRRWLGEHLARWEREPVFAQRALIRDLRRAHPQVRRLERELRFAAESDAASPHAPRLREIDRDLGHAAKAIDGLSRALGEAPPQKQPALREKLTAFREKLAALEAERAELVRSSPERQALLRLAAELDSLRRETGLDREEARLRQLLTERGRQSGRSGESFEAQAATVTRGHILPGLAAAGDLRLFRGVTLGAARTEFDQLVVRAPGGGGPVEVLAVVEAKRNVNDLAHGFARRQEDLAWLTGERDRYDPAEYRTRAFPAGHFDRPAGHRQDGETFALAPGSFRRFTRDPAAGLFLDRLYLVTRDGPVWGLSAAALNRIGYRVATDAGWDPESESGLRRLFDWGRSLAGPFETPDLLALFAATPERARQVLVLGPDG